MKRRSAAVAGFFYPAARDAAEAALRDCWRRAAPSRRAALTGTVAIAPHAGWSYSGRTLAVALEPLLETSPETVVLLGAAHTPQGVRGAALDDADAWETPLGDAPVDVALRDALVSPLLRVDSAAHAREHSIEVLVPFVLHRLPGAAILPLVVPPGCGASEVGLSVVRAAADLGRRIVVVGSSDLTHYGTRYGFAPQGTGAAAHRWSVEVSDRAILERALALDPAGVEASARACRNACGPGAMAAAVAAAAALGATTSTLLDHTTSSREKGEEPVDLWVGYAAVLYGPQAA